MEWIIYMIAGLGAGVVTGLAGLSAAVVITPLLVSLCGWASYDAVTVALASDVLASLLTAFTYAKSKNIDVKRGSLVGVTALIGTIIGSLVGYLFSQAQPDGLGYISMATTIFLGIKFLWKPITGGKAEAHTFESSADKKKTLLAMIFGVLIGFVCGFTGSGGGILMLTVFTLVLGYNLKIAVGTSTMIMTAVALTGAVSHFAMGAQTDIVAMLTVVFFCLASAFASARYANKCDIKKLNRVVGGLLVALGVAMLLIKLSV